MSDIPLAIGIDFGGTSVKSGVLYRGNIIDEAPRIDTQEYLEAEPLIQTITATIDTLRQSHPMIKAIGIGMPGFVDFKKGLVHNLTNVKGWQNIYLKDRLEELTGLPVTIENDANCMAYAEWKRGAGRGMSNLVALTLGTGVGGGLIVNGQMVRGHQSAAGELGQTSIHWEGRRGPYGNLGCIENYIGNRQISGLAVEMYAAAGISKTTEECPPARLAKDATFGDEIALSIWEKVAEKLACALLNCCYLLNPEGLIIGGGISKAGDPLFSPLDHKLRAQLALPFSSHMRILPARFGNEAGIVGAAALALEEAGFNIDD